MTTISDKRACGYFEKYIQWLIEKGEEMQGFETYVIIKNSNMLYHVKVTKEVKKNHE